MIKRGQIYLVTKQNDSFRQTPMVVVSNDVGNTYAPIVLCAKMSLGLKRYKTQAQVTNNGKKSIVFCDQIEPVDKSRLISFKGELSSDDMDRVDRALETALGLDGVATGVTTMRGRVVYVENPGYNKTGCEQTGARPAVVVSSDYVNKAENCECYNVVYFTTRYKTRLPTHVIIPRGTCGLPRTSLLLCEQISTVPKDRVTVYEDLTRVPMSAVDHALKVALGLIEVPQPKIEKQAQ